MPPTHTLLPPPPPNQISLPEIHVTRRSPNSLALAAAAQAANDNRDDDDAGEHRHGDDQDLEVDCGSKGENKIHFKTTGTDKMLMKTLKGVAVFQ